MSAKLKLTVWIASMMLLLSLLTLAVGIWVDNTSLIDSVQERLVETVLENEKLLSAEADPVVWDEVDFFSRGVYCAFLTIPDGYCAGSPLTNSRRTTCRLWNTSCAR